MGSKIVQSSGREVGQPMSWVVIVTVEHSSPTFEYTNHERGTNLPGIGPRGKVMFYLLPGGCP